MWHINYKSDNNYEMKLSNKKTYSTYSQYRNLSNLYTYNKFKFNN